MTNISLQFVVSWLPPVLDLPLDSPGMFISASRDRTMKVWLASTWQAGRTLSPPHYDGEKHNKTGVQSHETEF